MTKLCLLSHIAFFGEVFHKSLSYHIIVIIDKVCMCRTGEHGHPTRTWTGVYRLPNMHSDCNAKEPGSLVWQSEHILMCSDGISSHCPHLREAHRGIPRASTVLLPSRMPHTLVLHPRGLSHRGQQTWGSFIQFYRHASDDLAAV